MRKRARPAGAGVQAGVEKRANRKWINETEVSLFLGSLKVSDDDIFEPRKIRTPAQMEKKLPSHYQMLTKFVTKESSGLVLVPEQETPGV